MATTELQPAGGVVLLSDTGNANPDVSICTHTGVAVTSAPSDTRLNNPADQPLLSSLLQSAGAWINLPVHDPYVVLMWAPDTPSGTFSLVSGDSPNAPVVCTDEVDNDV
jgi:hypothetical protein